VDGKEKFNLKAAEGRGRFVMAWVLWKRRGVGWVSFLCWSLTALPFDVDGAMCHVSERTPFMGFIRAESLVGKAPEMFLLLFTKRSLCC
jgi:hypothetical protein